MALFLFAVNIAAVEVLQRPCQVQKKTNYMI